MNEKEMYEIVKKAAEPKYSVSKLSSRIYLKKYSDRLGKDMPLLSIYKANHFLVEAKAELSNLARNPKEYIRNSKLNNIGI